MYLFSAVSLRIDFACQLGKSQTTIQLNVATSCIILTLIIKTIHQDVTAHSLRITELDFQKKTVSIFQPDQHLSKKIVFSMAIETKILNIMENFLISKVLKNITTHESNINTCHRTLFSDCSDQSLTKLVHQKEITLKLHLVQPHCARNTKHGHYL